MAAMNLMLRSSSGTSSPLSNGTAQQSEPGGIQGAYDGSLTVKLIIVFSLGLSMYNAVEIVILVFLVFARYHGVYFYSLLVASIGIIPYSVGFILKFFGITTPWFYVTIVLLGWFAMVTGQSVVLWSRLHLIIGAEKRGERILKWTKWMIVVDGITLHGATAVLAYGSQVGSPTYVNGYNVMEKIQMVGFFVQETLFSSIYMYEAVRLLQTSLQRQARSLLFQLLAINCIIILMDVAIVGLESASEYTLQVVLKATVYSIKLKLEFAVLSRLVQFVARRRRGTDFANANQSLQFSALSFRTERRKRTKRANNEVPSFVDVEKVVGDVKHPTLGSTGSSNQPLRSESAGDPDLVIRRNVPDATDDIGGDVEVRFRDVDLSVAHPQKPSTSDP